MEEDFRKNNSSTGPRPTVQPHRHDEEKLRSKPFKVLGTYLHMLQPSSHSGLVSSAWIINKTNR